MTPRARLAVLVAGTLAVAAFALARRPAAPAGTAGGADPCAELAELVRETGGRYREAQLAGRAASARDGAVAAYRGVVGRAAECPPAAAEAAFRAGEILRAAGRTEEARAAFERARSVADGGDLGVRAALELAHLERRAERIESALAGYRAVERDPRALAARRDEAALWSGRMLATLGRDGEARATFERIARAAADPRDRCRAWDELACAALDDGDLAGAAALLQHAREALAPITDEETDRGREIGERLGRMRALGRLRRAIAAPAGSR